MIQRLKPNEVEWIINDYGDLGVKIGDQKFFLYKGESLEYKPPPSVWNNEHHDYPEKWRPVLSREFGVSCNVASFGEDSTAPLVKDGSVWYEMFPQPDMHPMTKCAELERKRERRRAKIQNWLFVTSLAALIILTMWAHHFLGYF